MPVKAILLPTEANETMAATFETAAAFARHFAGHIEGIDLAADLQFMLAGDLAEPLSAVMLEQQSADSRRNSRQMFDNFFGKAELGEAHATWRDNVHATDSDLGAVARAYDLTVLGRPGQSVKSPRMASLEAAMFESGRAILVAPPTPATSFGEHVMIAWNQSTETARAVAMAGLVLRTAKHVTVLTVEGAVVPGPTGEELAERLRWRGFSVEAFTVKPTPRGSGDTILAEAVARGCDLLIKGAYTQSRLRQMFFGGATSHILANTPLPVFMSS